MSWKIFLIIIVRSMNIFHCHNPNFGLATKVKAWGKTCLKIFWNSNTFPQLHWRMQGNESQYFQMDSLFENWSHAIFWIFGTNVQIKTLFKLVPPSTIAKVLKHMYQKWVHIFHLDIWSLHLVKKMTKSPKIGVKTFPIGLCNMYLEKFFSRVITCHLKYF